MEKRVKVLLQSGARSFAAQNGEQVTVVDVLLDDGLNQYIASAFDKEALALSQQPLVCQEKEYTVDLQMTVNKTQEGKYFQKVKLVRIKPV